MTPLARIGPRGTAAEAFLAARGRRLESSPSNPRLPDPLSGAVAGLDLDDDLLWETWELVRCASAKDPSEQAAISFLVAACLVAARRGSTRLPLKPPGALDVLLAGLGAGKSDRARVRAIVSAPPGKRGGIEPIFGEAGDFKPLVVEDGFLYLQRLRELEERLAQSLAARLSRPMPAQPGLTEALADVAARPAMRDGEALRLSPEQEAAVRAALEQPLCVVTGGPGTGKTSIVVALLRVLARLGVSGDSVALAAPTGKAANRLEESIRRALEAVASPSAADVQLRARGPVPSTLHRLLGYSPRSDAFLHHENNPLSERVVVVDECSMVDLSLMHRLVRAVDPDKARLILLGDADQLPSVEAGAVFRDLVPALSSVRLTHSFRQDATESGAAQILEVAARINQNRPDELLSALALRESPAEVRFEGVELVPSSAPEVREAMLARWFAERLRGLPGLDALLARAWQPPEEGLDALFRHFDRSRILCATRSDARPTGAAAVNLALRRLWLKAMGVPEGADAPRLLLGQPVMAERNDYARALFNGDQGLVLRVRDGEGRTAAQAVFPRRDGFAVHPLEAGAALAPCFAMTVHKAQGSEHEAVLLILPEDEMPLVSREVLYTALTRARRSVVILGDPAVLLAGARRPLQRFSGVGERLARALR